MEKPRFREISPASPSPRKFRLCAGRARKPLLVEEPLLPVSLVFGKASFAANPGCAQELFSGTARADFPRRPKSPAAILNAAIIPRAARGSDRAKKPPSRAGRPALPHNLFLPRSREEIREECAKERRENHSFIRYPRMRAKKLERKFATRGIAQMRKAASAEKRTAAATTAIQWVPCCSKRICARWRRGSGI